MAIFKRHDYILPTDIVLFAYLAITTIYMLIFRDSMLDFWEVLGARFVVVLVMAQIIVLHKMTHSLWVKDLHILLPLFLTGYLYGETHSLNHLLISENLDPFFMNLDQKLFGFQPSLVFSEKFNKSYFGELMYLGYISYYLQMIVLALFVYFKDKAQLIKTVFIIITSFLIYYLIFSVLPVVGPQFHFIGAEAKPPQSGFLSEFMMQINHNFEKPTGAFPSSHVGMTLIYLYLASLFSKKLMYIFLPFSLLILFATVYIKAHYAVDVFAGILSAPLIYWLSIKIYGFITKN